jgi:hypothetical protein
MVERNFEIHADAIGATVIEMYSLEAQRNRLVISNTLDLKEELKTVLSDIGNWLPVAAEALNISPKIKDYILSPVISMPSDLPNRNQQGFPFTELTRWTVDAGTIMYRTWNGKPVHLEHNNKDPSIAKGVILSTLMRPIVNSAGNIWKLIKLAAVDRNRDSVLANKILTGELNSWSMGAIARDYTCTICGQLLTKTLKQLGCEHVKHGKPDFQVYAGKLAYYNVVDPIGFELSIVSSPAFYSAKNMQHFTL